MPHLEGSEAERPLPAPVSPSTSLVERGFAKLDTHARTHAEILRLYTHNHTITYTQKHTQLHACSRHVEAQEESVHNTGKAP